MLKNLKRIALIILLLIIVGHNYCYADAIALPTKSERFFLFDGGAFMVGAIVLIMTLISFYILKFTARNNNDINNIQEKNANKDKKFNIIMIIAIILHCLSLCLVKDPITMMIWIIPMILFIMSKAIRKSSQKISKILLIIAIIAIVIIIAILINNIRMIPLLF